MQLSVNIISTNCRFVKNFKINASHLGSSACVDREALSVNFNNSVTSSQTCHVQVCCSALVIPSHSIKYRTIRMDGLSVLQDVDVQNCIGPWVLLCAILVASLLYVCKR